MHYVPTLHAEATVKEYLTVQSKGGTRSTSNVQKELAASFFTVRLWTQKDLLEQLFANYDKLDEDLKAELPLKRIWTVAAKEDE